MSIWQCWNVTQAILVKISDLARGKTVPTELTRPGLSANGHDSRGVIPCDRRDHRDLRHVHSLMNRPSTPPPTNASRAQDTPLTPERVRQIEINRLRAKARQRQREEAEASSSSSVNAHGKRPLSNNTVTKSPTTPGKQKPLARDSRLGKYFDYDLSKMVNTKGGFLVEDDKEVDETMIAKERQRERERAKHNLEPRTSLYRDPISGMHSSIERNIAGPEDEPEV